MKIDSKLTDKQALRAWKLLYCLMDNFKTKMDNDFEVKKGLITEEDYFEIIKYICHSTNNVTGLILKEDEG